MNARSKKRIPATYFFSKYIVSIEIITNSTGMQIDTIVHHSGIGYTPE